MDYPNNPCYVLATNGRLLCIVEFAGWFPNVYPKRALVLNDFFGTDVKDEDPPGVKQQLNSKKLAASSDVLQSIAYDRNDWQFFSLPVDVTSVLSNEKIKIHNILTNIDEDELRTLYYRLLSAGIPWTKMISIIKVRYNYSSDEALDLIRQFDKSF